MGCCATRRSDPALLAAHGTEAAKVRVTVVLGLAGQRFSPAPFDADAPLLELQAAIRAELRIPVAAQRLILENRVLESEGQLLGPALGVPQGGEVEVTCIRTNMPPEIQRAADCSLLLAAARGCQAQLSQALEDGAQASGLGGGPDCEEASLGERQAPTPLMMALALGEKGGPGAAGAACAALLRAAGAAEPDMEPRATSLGQAFTVGCLADVVRLLARRADPNTVLRRGEGLEATSGGSALHACCALQRTTPGALEVAQLLCKLRADLDSTDAEGDTPLAHARYFQSREMYSLLEAHGAKVAGPFYRFRRSGFEP
ncbi:unnamed protein product [Polarella glacialis]|uniref:Ubiquitin-like domain-containing protein n=3 Tax=Polarella glacialis TaxID=89957 RepID=A0A813LJH3_POLGL|nr:unnamed protein product [Polarella glacialis]